MINNFVIRNYRGTCLSVEMLKGYMVREKLKTPSLEKPHSAFQRLCAALLRCLNNIFSDGSHLQ